MNKLPDKEIDTIIAKHKHGRDIAFAIDFHTWINGLARGNNMKQISNHPNYNTFIKIENTHIEEIKHATLATKYLDSQIERSHDFYLDKDIHIVLKNGQSPVQYAARLYQKQKNKKKRLNQNFLNQK
mgnify:CR=1 FL=1